MLDENEDSGDSDLAAEAVGTEKADIKKEVEDSKPGDGKLEDDTDAT